MAPITVTSSPRDGWARAPTSSMRSMTDWISSSVAAAFITIIIGTPRNYAVGHSTDDGHSADRSETGSFTTECLEKSPGGTARGAGVGIRGEEGGELSGAGAHGAERQLYQHRRERWKELATGWPARSPPAGRPPWVG